MTRPDSSNEGATLEHAILALLCERRPGQTICPSEVARRLGRKNWRSLMEPVRATARELSLSGKIIILQGGRPVAPGALRGPIRLGLPEAARSTPIAGKR